MTNKDNTPIDQDTVPTSSTPLQDQQDLNIDVADSNKDTNVTHQSELLLEDLVKNHDNEVSIEANISSNDALEENSEHTNTETSVANSMNDVVLDGNELNSSDVSKNPSKKKLLDNKYAKLAISIGLVGIFAVGGTFHFLSKNKDGKDAKSNQDQQTAKVEKQDIIYRTTLDSSQFLEDEIYDLSYPFGFAPIENTKQYSRSLFEKVDSIIVDPTGQNFPPKSGLLESFVNANYGYATFKLDLNSLPKQPLFIRLVSERDESPYAIRHYYMNSDSDRVLILDGLSGGKYYLQILNLITQTAYVSNTFNLTSNGLITGDSLVKFVKIKEIDHIFRVSLEEEDTTLLVEDIPIVLNADINREVLDFSRSRAIKEATMDDQ